MSATTIAIATITETLDPPVGSRLGHAALPISDAVMSVHALGAHARDFFIVQAGPPQFKQCYQCVKSLARVAYNYTFERAPSASSICGIAKAKWPPHNRDTISCFLRLP